MGILQTNKKRLYLEGESIILEQHEIGIGPHLIVFPCEQRTRTSTLLVQTVIPNQTMNFLATIRQNVTMNYKLSAT